MTKHTIVVKIEKQPGMREVLPMGWGDSQMA
jgi:hypothetical protein